MLVSDLDTPALIIDLDVMERNLRRVAEYARSHGLALRPHTKTHKTPALGRLQVALGAVGLTVAKVSEAEVMADADPPGLLVAYPVWGRAKLERLAALARRLPVLVALDSEAVARPLSAAACAAGVEIGVLTEFDAGQGRVGVSPGPELNQLVAAVRGLPGLRWDGVLFYPGHLKHAHSDGVAGLSSLLEETLAGLRREGHEPAIVSGGSTPTLFDSHQVRGLTEIRPGTYIFNDRNCVVSGCAEWEDCAASVLVTVVSTARPGQMIVDGGSKTFSSDGLVDGSDSLHGRVIEAPAARFLRMNEEHGYVALDGAGARFQVGDRVRIIPNHICVAVNLHEKIYGIRGDQVEQVWTVEARGKLQ